MYEKISKIWPLKIFIKSTKNEIFKEKESNGNWFEKQFRKLFPRNSFFTLLKDNLSWVNIISMVLEKQEKEDIITMDVVVGVKKEIKKNLTSLSSNVNSLQDEERKERKEIKDTLADLSSKVQLLHDILSKK